MSKVSRIPFVHPSVIKKVKVAISSGASIVKTYSRSSTILPEFVGITFFVYNGKTFISFVVNEFMVGHKLGEFSHTRTFYSHSGDKSAKK